MIPWREVKNEMGRTVRESWPRDKANAMLAAIRQKHIDRCNREDCERAKALGLGEWINQEHGSLNTCRVIQTADGPQQVVDPVCSRIKHSGAKVWDRTIVEWREFCSKPQDPEQFQYEAPKYVPKEPGSLDGMDSIDVGSTAAVAPPGLEPFKPGKKRGRPRKTEMVAAESGGNTVVMGV